MSTINASGPKKAAKVLACVNCQQRKKKCDRRSPCSICVKHNADCVPSTPAPPRRRRQPTKELLERMTRCEELLKECLQQGIFANNKLSSCRIEPFGESKGSPDSLSTTSTRETTTTTTTQTSNSSHGENDVNHRKRLEVQ